MIKHKALTALVAVMTALIVGGSMTMVVSAAESSIILTGPPMVREGQTFVVSGAWTIEGEDMSEAWVGIWEVFYDDPWPEPDPVYRGLATCDANGAFSTTIEPLSVGDHVLMATSLADHPDTPEPWGPPVTSNELTVHVDTFSLSLAASPNPATTEQSIQLSGRLTMDSSGAGAGMQTLAIKEIVTKDGQVSSTVLSTPSTDADGYYKAIIGPLSAGTHTLIAKMGPTGEGETPDWALSDQLSVVVTAPATLTAVKVNPTTITVGDPFVVSGTVTTSAGAAVTEGSVELWLQRPSATGYSYWRAPAVSSPSGFSTSNTPDVSLTPGTYLIKAKYVGTANFLDSESSVPATLIVQSHETTALTTAEDLKSDLQTGAIPATAFQNANNAKAFSNKLSEVIAAINAGDHATAMQQIQNDLMKKTDGVPLTGTPDKNDWVKADQQTAIYNQLQSIVTDLQQLQQQ